MHCRFDSRTVDLRTSVQDVPSRERFHARVDKKQCRQEDDPSLAYPDVRLLEVKRSLAHCQLDMSTLTLTCADSLEASIAAYARDSPHAPATPARSRSRLPRCRGRDMRSQQHRLEGIALENVNDANEVTNLIQLASTPWRCSMASVCDIVQQSLRARLPSFGKDRWRGRAIWVCRVHKIRTRYRCREGSPAF